MLYTNNFLFLHIPKTGGTFARIAIRNALTVGKLDLVLHRLAFGKYLPPVLRVKVPGYPYKYREHGEQHSFWKSVPYSLRHLRVLSIVRDPIQWAYSHYKFGVVSRELERKVGKRITNFDQYMRLWDKEGNYAVHKQNCGRVGNLSTEFICFFLDIEDRPKVFCEHPDIDAMCQAMRHYMPSVEFLHNESLNEDLSRFLETCGYTSDVCSQVENHAKVNVSREGDSSISSSTTKLILDREAFLYRMFPEYLWAH